ncbi:MAG: BON domain-containing protein [Desulfobacterales bacterium]|jgi:osmotically-inducible protein OsmY
MTITEEALRRDIIGRLERDVRVVGDLHVYVSGGRVSVTGTVPSQGALETVAQVVLDVPGVSHLENKLVVAEH